MPLENRVLLVSAAPLLGISKSAADRIIELSGAKAAVGRAATVIADGGYRGTGLVIPHRREPDRAELPAWKEERSCATAA